MSTLHLPVPSQATGAEMSSYQHWLRSIAVSLRLPYGIGVDYDDLVQVGWIALMEAEKRYDAASGVPFVLFAKHATRGAMLDLLRRIDPATRTQRSLVKLVNRINSVEQRQAAIEKLTKRQRESLATAPKQIKLLDDHDIVSIADCFESVAINQQIGRIVKVMNAMPPRRKEAVRLVFFGELTMAEAAEQMGCNESRISQQITAFVRIVRERLGVPRPDQTGESKLYHVRNYRTKSVGGAV